MSEKEKIKKSLEVAQRFARKRGLSREQGEDLAQRYVIKRYVEQTGQSLEQAYVDFLRFEFGDTRTTYGACKSEARRYSKDIDGDVERGADSFREHNRYSDEFARDQKRRRQLKLLTYKEEVIVQLLATNKLTQVANMLGVTQGRISQIKAKITEKMQIVNIDKALKVDWITL